MHHHLHASIEDSEFAIHNRKEIVFILDDLAKHRVMINLDSREGESLVTAVLGVNSDTGQLYIDASGDDGVNQRLAGSSHLFFVTQTGVKVRWHSSHLRLVELTDGLAFAMHIPAVIERIQRREYFRLNTPQGSKALTCRIPVGESVIEATVVDMSVGGVGLSIRGALAEVFSQGAVLEGCSIQFPEIGPVPVNLRVCGTWLAATTRSGEQLHRLGMQFENLSRGAGNVIQRYMIQLEADRLSLS